MAQVASIHSASSAAAPQSASSEAANEAPTTAQVSAVAPVRTARTRQFYDLAEVFPEVPELRQLPAEKRVLPGYAESRPDVPRLIPGFVQEFAFLERALAFLRNPNRLVFTLYGATGCGKSERWRDLFGRLNVPLYEIAVNADTREHQLLGHNSVKAGKDGQAVIEFVYGPILKAMKNGWPVLINEAFRLDPAITAKLHTIADNGTYLVPETGEFIQAKSGFSSNEYSARTTPNRPGFKLLLTANQSGYGDDTMAYVGDHDQDAAWLSRSDGMKVGYMEAEAETRVLQELLTRLEPQFGTDSELKTWARKMVQVANDVRSISFSNPDAERQGDLIEITISMRELKAWCQYLVEYSGNPGDHALYKALDHVVLDRARRSTRLTVEGFVLANFGIARNPKPAQS